MRRDAMTIEETETSRRDVYQTVTQQIISAVEAGSGRWVMPWHATGAPLAMPQNPSTEARYRGINVISLWIAAAARGYGQGYWASYNQWQRLGAHVRKGERGVPIVFYKELELDHDDRNTRQRFMARTTKVFNVGQIEGWVVPEPPLVSKVETSIEIDAFVKATSARIHHGSYVACYDRRTDQIELPVLGQFVGTATSSPTEAYYAVLLHELTHWTGAPNRLDRTFGARFGDHAYAFEELVAELGAAFLCSGLGVSNEPRPDHAAYISSWLEILGRDAKAIFTAASQAQRAVGYLESISGIAIGK